jgi:FkbM family methyltransferase
MIMHIFKKLLKKFFYVFGLEVHRSGGQRLSFVGALQQIKNLGFTPASVIDVGASVGSFTMQCHRVFPDSKYLLIEPLEENRALLDQVTKRIPNAEYVLAVATSEPGEVTLNVHSDLVGSSLYLEKETGLDGVPRNVPAVTLDDLCRDRSVPGPYLIKIDVQGAELDVLSGAREVLDRTEYVILEVSLFQFAKGGPQLYDVVTFMKSHGFVAYDILGWHYRPLDGALAQMDMAFVKEISQFRKHHIYTNPKQRKELTKRMLRGRT